MPEKKPTKLMIAGVSLVPFTVVMGCLVAILYNTGGRQSLFDDPLHDAIMWPSLILGFFLVSLGAMYIPWFGKPQEGEDPV